MRPCCISAVAYIYRLRPHGVGYPQFRALHGPVDDRLASYRRASMPLQVIPPRLYIFPLEERLRICRTLADFVQDSFAGPQLTPCNQPGDRMILASWARAAGTFSAALLLAEQHYGDQVGMLARALFENTIDAYWISVNPIKAQRLGVLHFR